MKIFKVIIGVVVVILFAFNWNYTIIKEDLSGQLSLKIVELLATAQTEEPTTQYYDEEPYSCSCGAWVFKCVKVTSQSSCNVSGQIPCSEACDPVNT